MKFINQNLIQKLKKIRFVKNDSKKRIAKKTSTEAQKKQKIRNALADLEISHNHSWTKDLYRKNINNLDDIAIFYRGTKITYREMFHQAEKYAAMLSSKGIDENSEVPICMSNCPEFIYAIMGINLLGAKMNCFGEFNKDYLTEIMNGCNSPLLLCSDDKYEYIKESINKSKINEVIMVSLATSLKNEKNPYSELDEGFYNFENKIQQYKNENSMITDINDALATLDEKNILRIEDYNQGNIDTEFLVTYTSGSTNAERPKALVHSNRSLITIGRFQEPDLAELPPTKNLTGLMLIPNHSNTSVITSMSDVLYKSCTVALEPIYNTDFFLISLAINKPNYVAAPRHMILESMKKIYADPRYENFKMPYMMMITSVGEPTSMGEEKFINKMLRKANCGVEKLPRPISPVPLSIGGGDCERGGMFFTPYRRYMDFLPKYKFSNSRCELKQYAHVALAILDENGNELPRGEVGRLVVNVPTMMKYYKNDPEATKKLYITDSTGQTWTDCGTYSLVEKHGTTKILERIGKEIILDDNTKFPLYNIGNIVEQDTKNILSYEVVNIENELVVHLTFQPNRRTNAEKAIIGIHKRILKKFGPTIADKILYRTREFEESFPSTNCAKRSYPLLVTEGITDRCVRPVIDDNRILLQRDLESKKIKTKKK